VQGGFFRVKMPLVKKPFEGCALGYTCSNSAVEKRRPAGPDAF
jgi:hypothetical protein